MSSKMDVNEFTKKLIEYAPDFEKNVTEMLDDPTLVHDVSVNTLRNYNPTFNEWIVFFSEWMQNGAPQYVTPKKNRGSVNPSKEIPEEEWNRDSHIFHAD